MKAEPPLLRVRGLTKSYGRQIGCRNVEFDLHVGEVLALVGESGSGKTTVVNCVSGQLPPTAGRIFYRRGDGAEVDVVTASEATRRQLSRTEWGFVHQNARDGVRMNVTAGANVGEPLMMLGHRHYADLRRTAEEWLRRVEIDPCRIDDRPTTFSGGMLQRLQIARNLVTQPRLVFLDEPTGGLDVSVQARLLDLLRTLVRTLHLAVIVVTHDLAVARLLAHSMMVMKGGEIIERGLTDQVLDDPQQPYTQLLVSAILQP